ncbi:THAP domain-containing protein 11-like [Ixodes scapularis]|uniref:THAP domain-containing protein 11-like n=1 Tax=Ixodes scapularis TaxID=6945 RepID=UPI001A9E07CD|nr:THAP domain-containing protein 11-like [Ixodes scapularis]
MPRNCAAQGCSYSVWYSGRPMHTFPSDPTLRKLWIRVARPSQPTWVPAKGDCLCTDHFAEEDYVRSPAVLRSLGLPVKHVFLKPGVVPSLFTRKRKQAQLSGVEEKRRREEIIDELLKEPPQATVTETTEVVLNASTSFAAYTEQSPKARHDPIKETSIQVTPETPSRHTQTNPVVVTPQCSSPNHVPQAQLDWTLPNVQKQLLTSPSLPLVPPDPPQPPEPPTVVEEEHSQDDLEDVDGDSLKELQPKHVEADVSYRPSDASFRMMLSDNSLRDDQVNTAFQDNTSTGGGVVDYISERKFITFESCLDELLMRCPKCTALMRTSRKKVKGPFCVTHMC